MGDTSKEGFFPPFSTVVSQGLKDDYLWDHEHEKTHSAKDPTIVHKEKVDHIDVWTGKFQQWL